MPPSPLDRVHIRLDQILSELSTLSQRVAKVEVQESRLQDISRDIDKLYERIDAMISAEDRVGRKSKGYIETGGLVLTGGAVAEAIRQLLQAFGKN